MGCSKSKPAVENGTQAVAQNTLLNTSLPQSNFASGAMDPLGVQFQNREAAHSLDPGLSVFSTGVESRRYQSKHQSKFVPSSVRTPSVASYIASSYVGSDCSVIKLYQTIYMYVFLY